MPPATAVDVKWKMICLIAAVAWNRRMGSTSVSKTSVGHVQTSFGVRVVCRWCARNMDRQEFVQAFKGHLGVVAALAGLVLLLLFVGFDATIFQVPMGGWLALFGGSGLMTAPSFGCCGSPWSEGSCCGVALVGNPQAS